MQTFYIFTAIVILQRLIELVIAKRNEIWMKRNGAKEFGQEHYQIIVLIHVFFFISFILEAKNNDYSVSVLWPVLLSFFFVSQLFRFWCMKSLGRFWNTKILVMPNVTKISKGPYKHIRHPNYLVVAFEFLIIPLIFNAYLTAFLFILLHTLIMLVRIPLEEKALLSLIKSDKTYSQKSRFIFNKNSIK